jgi:hypothetical protein
MMWQHYMDICTYVIRYLTLGQKLPPLPPIMLTDT